MVNGCPRALKSVSIASALSSAFTIYPCQIRVHQTLTVLTPTSYSSEEGVAAGHSGQFTDGGCLSTVNHTTNRLLVRRATSCATETETERRRGSGQKGRGREGRGEGDGCPLTTPLRRTV